MSEPTLLHAELTAMEDIEELIAIYRDRPEHALELLHVLLNARGEFQRLIKDGIELLQLVMALSPQASEILNRVLSDVEELTRLVPAENLGPLAMIVNLQDINLTDHHRHVLSQPTRAQAIEVIEAEQQRLLAVASEAELRKVARLLFQGYSQPACSLSALPLAALSHIAALGAGNPEVHTKAQREAIASTYCARPGQS